jgi:DNA-binding response OmpR family regulator
VLIPDDILSKVWGEEYCGETHIIQVNMARLRKKLGDDAKNPKYIMTRPGIGYSMIKQI